MPDLPADARPQGARSGDAAAGNASDGRGPGALRIEVIAAWPGRHVAVQLILANGATVADAVHAALLPATEDITGYAVFGLIAAPETRLRDGDRVELLRPLVADPKQARQARARPDRATRDRAPPREPGSA